MTGVLTTVLVLCLAGSAGAQVERRLERTFKVSADSLVSVRLAGGSITAITGGAGAVEVLITQRVRGTSSDREVDEILADYDVSATQQGDRVAVVGMRKRDRDGSFWNRRGVEINATVTVPAGVRLDLLTSGGSIDVRGERTAALTADTSGGSLMIEGGRGAIELNTSGGSIRVTRALATLRAKTSGGSINVSYVGPSASDVTLDTSGGSITVGVDKDAKLDINAETSGGHVSVDGLNLSTNGAPLRRTHVSGLLNGGGGRLRAATSGGSIFVRAAAR